MLKFWFGYTYFLNILNCKQIREITKEESEYDKLIKWFEEKDKREKVERERRDSDRDEGREKKRRRGKQERMRERGDFSMH